jgi:hypothetical protein
MKRVFVFILIGFLLLVLVNGIFTAVGNIYKDGASIIGQKKREAVRNQTLKSSQEHINILFFGASDILSGIIPDVFDSVMEYRTYSLNLALPALPIGSSYFYLRDYVTKNPAPDYVLLALHPYTKENVLFEKYACEGLNFPEELLSYFVNMRNAKILVTYFLPAQRYMYAGIDFANHLIFNFRDIRKTIVRNDSIIAQMISQRGYYYIREQSKSPDNRLPYDFIDPGDTPNLPPIQPDPWSDPYFTKFMEYTRDQNIGVMIINYPIRKNKNSPYESVPEAYTRIQQKFPHVRIGKEMWKVKYYPNSDFSDPNHLNKYGAYKYTVETASEFNKIYSD